MANLLLIIVMIILHFNPPLHAYECTSDHPTTDIDQCDHGICDNCARTCTKYIGWDATCKLTGSGMIVETCDCRKSDPKTCTDEHPNTGMDKCDTVCRRCEDSCANYSGWNAECDFVDGVLKETCECKRNRKRAKRQRADVLNCSDSNPKTGNISCDIGCDQCHKTCTDKGSMRWESLCTLDKGVVASWNCTCKGSK